MTLHLLNGSAGACVPLPTPFIAVGDSEEHKATGFPLHDNDNAVDVDFEFAHGPPERRLFGRRILDGGLQSLPGEPFLHLAT
jgi:hypothetical protein